MRRLLHDREEDGVIVRKCFERARRRWVAIDLDSVTPPKGLDMASELVGFLVSLLPPQFSGADLVLQMTGSAGFKPGIRARLWFWLDRPTSSAELKRWFKGRPVDASVFGDVQLIYIARPVLEGVDDPFPRRVFFLPGLKRAIEVPDLPEPPRPVVDPARVREHTSQYVEAALKRAKSAIASAAEGSRHETLNKEAFSLSRFVREGKLGEAELIASLSDAARPSRADRSRS